MKHRLRVVLETLTGVRTVEQACAELGLSPSRFHALRRQALEGALRRLAPGASGRPPREAEPTPPQEVETLRRRVRDLEVDLEAERVRTEIALTMPHLLRAGGKRRRRAGQP